MSEMSGDICPLEVESMETVDKASSVRPTGISCTNMSRLISEFDFLVWLFLSTEFIV